MSREARSRHTRPEAAQRLQKALAHVGLGSRREIEAWIRAGRLTVNGKLAELGTRVRDSDRIRLDGRLVRQRAAASQQVFLCHRSTGEPLDGSGDAHAPTLEALIDRLPRSGGRRFIPISPMPQQDGGLEIVTSDGELAERLQRVVHDLTGEFSVRLHGGLDETQLASVRSGELDSGERLGVLSCEPRGGEGSNRWYAVSVRGASGREVRRLFERSGAMVSRVLRTRLGSVALDRSLSRGRFRKLAPAELAALIESEAAPAHSDRSTARRSSRR
jgi:23S rRNA pseudouridine2605 synthase